MTIGKTRRSYVIEPLFDPVPTFSATVATTASDDARGPEPELPWLGEAPFEGVTLGALLVRPTTHG
jgi:hypothetical protein